MGSEVVLVTGGAGYIGSALISQLNRERFSVRVLDDFSLSSPRNLVGGMDYDFVRGDVRDAGVVREALEGVSYVVHLAAVTGADRTHEMRERTMDVNYGGTRTVLEEAMELGVEKLVLASSCNVYGAASRDHLTESSEVRPLNPYAESKLEAEEACMSSPVDSVVLRLSTNYGWSPGVRFNLVVNSFVFRSVVGEALTVYGDGENWRPFMHVRDSARAFVEALAWEEGIYNVGGENYRIKQIASLVNDVVGNVEVKYLGDEDPGPSYHVDFDKARNQEYSLNHSLRAGIHDLAGRFGG